MSAAGTFAAGKMPPFHSLDFFGRNKSRSFSANSPSSAVILKVWTGREKKKAKRGVKLQIGARLHSQTQSRISIHLKSFFPATWQMKVQYSLSFLPSFWSAEDPEGNNVADESHTVFCR